LAEPAPQSPLAARCGEIDALFAGSAPEIARALDTEEGAFAEETAAALRRSAPLSVACTLALIAAARAAPGLRPALAREYRFTWRSAADGDFIEGIRAAIIDKDRAPRWHHARLEDVTEAEVAAMLAPLGKNELAI
jgi:enoyl-CoA hydratase